MANPQHPTAPTDDEDRFPALREMSVFDLAVLRSDVRREMQRHQAAQVESRETPRPSPGHAQDTQENAQADDLAFLQAIDLELKRRHAARPEPMR